MIKIETDKQVEKAAKMLEGIPGGIYRAMASSFNRALQEGRTAGTREAAKQYTLKPSIVRKSIQLRRANKSDLKATLESRGARLPLEYYAHKPKGDTTGARRQQVTVAVKKGALKPLGQGFIHAGMVMQRLGSTRYPIERRYSLAVPNILSDDAVADVILDTMEKSVAKRLEHETERILMGYGAK